MQGSQVKSISKFVRQKSFWSEEKKGLPKSFKPSVSFKQTFLNSEKNTEQNRAKLEKFGSLDTSGSQFLHYGKGPGLVHKYTQNRFFQAKVQKFIQKKKQGPLSKERAFENEESDSSEEASQGQVATLHGIRKRQKKKNSKLLQSCLELKKKSGLK